MRLSIDEVLARALRLLRHDAAVVAAGGPLAGGKTLFAAWLAAAVARDGHGSLLVGEDDDGVAALEDALAGLRSPSAGIAATVRFKVYSEEEGLPLKRSTDLVVFDDAHRYQPTLPPRTGPRTVWLGELGSHHPHQASGPFLQWRETRTPPKIADWISQGRYEGTPLISVWRPPTTDPATPPQMLATFEERTVDEVATQCYAAVDYLESVTGDQSLEVRLAVIGDELTNTMRASAAHKRPQTLPLLGCDRPRSVVIGLSETDDELLARLVSTARENVFVVTRQGLRTPLLDLLPVVSDRPCH